MNILLLGSGGRESALAWKISQSELTDRLFIAPGNGGTSNYGTNIDIKPTDFEAIKRFATDNSIDLIVAGNEDPLVEGIADFFSGNGIPVVGPVKAGAMLEGSKDYAKQFMARHHIPTARYKSFTAESINEAYDYLTTLNAPYVLKADGLAAGKGVVICAELDEARERLKDMLDGQFGKASSTVVIEEFLKGIECSVFVLTDGTGNYITLPVAKDYKRIGEGDTGLNTGGMGAVSPVKFADDEFMQKVDNLIIKPTIKGLISDGIDYRGFIFFGLINVDGNPMVIEYNCRMGDPETEAIMPRIKSDLVKLMSEAATGKLQASEINISDEACATVICVSNGYPGDYKKGFEITINPISNDDVEYFHAGTKKVDDKLVTSGGRVIAVSSLGKNLTEALAKSYNAVEGIDYQGKTYRGDIGKDVL